MGKVAIKLKRGGEAGNYQDFAVESPTGRPTVLHLKYRIVTDEKLLGVTNHARGKSNLVRVMHDTELDDETHLLPYQQYVFTLDPTHETSVLYPQQLATLELRRHRSEVESRELVAGLFNGLATGQSPTAVSREVRDRVEDLFG